MVKPIFAFLVFAVSNSWGYSSYVSPDTASLKDFCHHPYQAVCGEQGDSEKRREAKLNEIKDVISRGALRRVAKRYPLIPKELLTEEGLQKIPNRTLKYDALHLFYQSFLDSIKLELGSAPLTAELHVKRIKNDLAQSVRSTLKFSQKIQSKMIEDLNKVEFIDVVKILDGEIKDTDLVDEAVKNCSKGGMEENALAVSANNKNYVIVCPGDYLPGIGPQDKYLPPEELLLGSEVWTLGHETGHHIDYSSYKRQYKFMTQCVADNYSKELDSKVEDYMKEISADFWGSEELAKYISKFESPEKKMRVVQESIEGLCETEDDKDHPSGRFRIEYFIRGNPSLYRALGCSGPLHGRDDRPVCTVDGEIKLN